MRGEINSDEYCAINGYHNGECTSIHLGKACVPHCFCRCLKWPTLRQFLVEYLQNWKGAVYVLWKSKHGRSYWKSYKIKSGEYVDEDRVICACTPWGKPPDDWRPEE